MAFQFTCTSLCHQIYIYGILISIVLVKYRGAPISIFKIFLDCLYYFHAFICFAQPRGSTLYVRTCLIYAIYSGRLLFNGIFLSKRQFIFLILLRGSSFFAPMWYRYVNRLSKYIPGYVTHVWIEITILLSLMNSSATFLIC